MEILVIESCPGESYQKKIFMEDLRTKYKADIPDNFPETERLLREKVYDIVFIGDYLYPWFLKFCTGDDADCGISGSVVYNDIRRGNYGNKNANVRILWSGTSLKGLEDILRDKK
jgi:hypothetical protein